MKALSDPEKFVRLAAIDALGKIKEQGAVKPLMTTLRDADPDIRWFSAHALGQIAHDEAIPDLILCLDDKANLSWDPKRVCDVAAEALECIATPEAIAAVAKWRRSQVVES